MNSIATQSTRAEPAHARELKSPTKWEKDRKALGREERELFAKVQVGRNEQRPFAEVQLLLRARRDDYNFASEPFDPSFTRRIDHERFRFVSSTRSGFALESKRTRQRSVARVVPSRSIHLSHACARLSA